MRFEDYMIKEGYRYVVGVTNTSGNRKCGWVRNGKFVSQSTIIAQWEFWYSIKQRELK